LSTELEAIIPPPGDLDRAQAEELTAMIKFGVIVINDLPDLIAAAYSGRVWIALDYSSWDAYCTAELDTDRVRIPRGERGDVIAHLRSAGMSVRAIAAATGTSVGTVARSVGSPVPSGTPAAANGDRDVPMPAKTIGTDGKTYVSSAPRPQRRNPLPDQYQRAVWELEKAVRRMEKLHQDDRLPSHRTTFAETFGGHITRIVNDLAEMRDELEGGVGR
jgi:hypothetical protein